MYLIVYKNLKSETKTNTKKSETKKNTKKTKTKSKNTYQSDKNQIINNILNRTLEEFEGRKLKNNNKSITNLKKNELILNKFLKRFPKHKNEIDKIVSEKAISINVKKMGIIKGHGVTVKERICLVPSNLNLYIPVHKGFVHKHCSNDNFQTIKFQSHRNEYKQLKDCDNGFMIYGDTPILDMLIQFSPTYPFKSFTGEVIKGYVDSYSFIGIISGDLDFLPDNNYCMTKEMKKEESIMSNRDINKKVIQEGLVGVKKTKKLYDLLKKETTMSHDNSIIKIDDLYMKYFYLSEILDLISLSRKINSNIPSTFILMSCRQYSEGEILNNLPLASLSRQESGSSNFHYIYINFTVRVKKKLEILKQFKNKSKSTWIDIILCINKCLDFFDNFKALPYKWFDLLYIFLYDYPKLKDFYLANISCFNEEYPRLIISDPYLNEKKEKIKVLKDPLHKS